MPSTLFEVIRMELHGGPEDGWVFPLHRSSLGGWLFNIGGTPNWVIFYFPTIVNPRLRHFYLSNGPIDLPILESHIDLYYKGTAP